MQSPDPGLAAESAAAGTSHLGVTPGAESNQEAAVFLPLVDAKVLKELEDELAGPILAKRFARDYAAMWDLRYTKLATAVESQDKAAALDAVISLKITSIMVGGVRLAKLAELLEALIRGGNFGEGQVLMTQVAQDGGQTVSELQATYILKNG